MSAEQMSVNNTQTVLDNDDCAVDKDGPLYKPNEETSESGKCVIFKSIICYLFSKPALVCECVAARSDNELIWIMIHVTTSFYYYWNVCTTLFWRFYWQIKIYERWKIDEDDAKATAQCKWFFDDQITSLLDPFPLLCSM